MVKKTKVKLIVLGDSGIGKSNFVRSFKQGVPCKSPLTATMGMDLVRKVIEREGKVYEVNLWDTAGTERFHSFTKNYLRDAHGAFIMFDQNTSLKQVMYWINFLEAESEPGDAHDQNDLNSSGRTIEWVLVKTKSDFERDGSKDFVSTSFVRLARLYGKPFFEVSSFEYKGIDESMDALLGQVIESGCLNEPDMVIQNRPQREAQQNDQAAQLYFQRHPASRPSHYQLRQIERQERTSIVLGQREVRHREDVHTFRQTSPKDCKC